MALGLSVTLEELHPVVSFETRVGISAPYSASGGGRCVEADSGTSLATWEGWGYRSDANGINPKLAIDRGDLAQSFGRE